MKDTVCDLVVRGRLVLPGGVSPGWVAVRDGRIARVALDAGGRPAARDYLNAGEDYVFPGFIDSHVHFREPGLARKEDWAAASRAAAAGGVTTVLDMPNTDPPLHHTEGVAAKVDLVHGRSLVDFGFHIGATPGERGALASLDPALTPSVKVFMAGHHTAPDVFRRAEDLKCAFRVAAERGLLLTLHAEDQGNLDRLRRAFGPAGGAAEHHRLYPPAAAVVAVGKILDLVDRFGTRAHVAHVSSAEEVDLLAGAKASGLPVTFEVLGHHLSLDLGDAEALGTFAKLRPPIRTAADRERLWDAVVTGLADTVGSDHAPHTRAEKDAPYDGAPPGLPGVQELVPSLLTGLRAWCPRLGADRRALVAAEVACAAPARLFGLAHRKGAIREGLDADLAVVALDRGWAFDPAQVQSRCGWSAYAGRTFVGLPRVTVVRGRIVYRDGCFVGGPAGGWVGPRQTNDEV